MSHLLPQGISLRTKPAGGAVGPAVPQNLTGLTSFDDVTLLIHGYATSESEARASFAKFRRNANLPSGRVIDVYWPGDAGFVGITQASYPFQRRRALESVHELLDYFLDQLDLRYELAHARNSIQVPLHVHIVAHSLGCLLALEFLKRLSDRPEREVEIISLSLMAGAVPQYRLAERDLGFIFEQVKDSNNYHSLRDLVLALAFPVGELVHRPFPEGFLPFVRRSAIGRNGLGSSFPRAKEHSKDHGHSGYWRDEEIARDHSKRVALFQRKKARTVQSRSVEPRELQGLA